MIVYEWEQTTSDWFAKLPEHGFIYEFMRHVSYPGQFGWLIVLIASLFYLWKQKDQVLLPMIVALAAVGIGDLIARRAVKVLVLRPRPHFIHQVCEGSHCWGFVSSHVTNITALVCVLIMFDRRRAIWGLPLIALISVSRLYLLDHYPLDVIGGIALGAFVGNSVFKIARPLVSGRTAACSKVARHIQLD